MVPSVLEVMVSIIMSSYNAGEFIAKGLESCLKQTHSDLEVIVVDDCSIDNTVEIVESYAKKDNRIRLIKHECNKGNGAARNTGVANIRGDYTIFLDCDDYLEVDCIETLYTAAKQYNASLVVPGHILDWFRKIVRKPRRSALFGNEKKGLAFKTFLNPILINSSLWNKVEYSKRRGIDDYQTLMMLYFFADSIYLLDYAGYHYVKRDDSITNSMSRTECSVSLALAMKDLIDFYIAHNALDEQMHAYALKVLRRAIERTENELKYTKERIEIKDCINKLMELQYV